ncbi:conserved hypothetical protein (plasmid) [Spirosoma linguale DSM 74]|uniref:Uncharacterized protein n=1 Tax=Spirosoma linguale (strain ATCC 33905 / DSM 74 / LMG 10896 / Claus 1) TaxID=504472 RepID=D2QVE5_SPILD|nr:conserved hypothetical protein [Spirosoma linguale DSM 74]
MFFPEGQIDELKTIAPNLSVAQEGGYTYVFIENLRLPNNCQPAVVNALLCPTPRDGYNSRLFFSEMINGAPARNWNGQIRVLGTNWYGISWQIQQSGLRLSEILINHINALR